MKLCRAWCRAVGCELLVNFVVKRDDINLFCGLLKVAPNFIRSLWAKETACFPLRFLTRQVVSLIHCP